MAYKIKSMLKQTSGTGLSVDYYLEQELNKLTDGNSEVVKPSNKGKSIAKLTEKLTTNELIKAKDTARERDEKKQIRKAGREAAKNAEVDFVKATPMGSDYFSLMAATAENIASRASQKRKAKKAAKEMKREEIRRSNTLGDKAMERIEGEPLKEITKDESKNKLEDTRVPKKTDRLDMTNYFESKRKKAQYDYDQEKKLKQEKKERDLVESINEAKLNTTPPGISGIGRKEIPIATPPFPISEEQQKQDSEYIQKKNDEVQKKNDEDLQEQFKGTGLDVLFMIGDGFSKGMSRKNKYKK